MKKLLLVFLGFALYSANAQTADEIIQKYSANIGGLEAFNKIKTAKLTATFSAQGNDIPMTVQVINGKAARTDLDAPGNKVIRVYKDGKGWIQNPFAGDNSPREATPTEVSDFKVQAMLTPMLMNYKALGHQVELLGQAEVEGLKTYKIKLTSKDDGRIIFYYINAKDYVLVKSEYERQMQGQTVMLETWYSDLKDLNGTKFFMTRTQKMNGQAFQTTTYSNIELNATIDEKIFDMPK